MLHASIWIASPHLCNLISDGGAITHTLLGLDVSPLVALAMASRELKHAVALALPTLGCAAWAAARATLAPKSLEDLSRLRAVAARSGSHAEMAAGGGHGVIISDAGLPYAVGLNAAEDQADAARASTPSMKLLDLNPTRALVVSVACGGTHGLLLDAYGRVYAFGSNCDGQLGLPAIRNGIEQPQEIRWFASRCAVQIAAGQAHSMVLAEPVSYSRSRRSAPTELYSFGLNEEGQLGIGDRTTSNYPALVRYVSHLTPRLVSCGDYHSALVTASGSLYTWGYGRAGRLGLGDEQDRLHPAHVQSPSQRSALVDWGTMSCFEVVACGTAFTLATLQAHSTRSRSIWVTGQGWDGQLGLGRLGQGAFVTSFTMVALPAPARVSWVAASDGAVVVLANGSVLAWGNTGPIAGDRLPTPVLVPALQGVRRIALGSQFAIATRVQKTHILWRNQSGTTETAEVDV